MLSLNEQIYLLVMTIACGLTLGFAFDVYRIIRWVAKPSKPATFIGDLIYWLLMTGLIFKVLLLASFGEVRLYIFIFIGLGGYVYFSLFSRFILNLLQRTVLLLVKFLGFFIRLFKIMAARIELITGIIKAFIWTKFDPINKMNNKILKKIKKVILIDFISKQKHKRKNIKREGFYSIGKKSVQD